MKIERVMQQLEIDAGEFRSLVADYEKFAEGLPQSPEDYIRESYNLNLIRSKLPVGRTEIFSARNFASRLVAPVYPVP